MGLGSWKVGLELERRVMLDIHIETQYLLKAKYINFVTDFIFVSALPNFIC